MQPSPETRQLRRQHVFAAVIVLTGATAAQAQLIQPPTGRVFNPTFTNEFNAGASDLNGFTYDVGAGNGWGNAEKQVYTGDSESQWVRQPNHYAGWDQLQQRLRRWRESQYHRDRDRQRRVADLYVWTNQDQQSLFASLRLDRVPRENAGRSRTLAGSMDAAER